MSNIQVTLSMSTDSLWRECFALEHEMILTVSGRRIFPTLEFVIAGLNPSKTYSACFHLEQVDDKRLRFTNKCWQETLSTETRETPRKVWHQQGAQSGSEWMCRPITFDHVRITNKKSKEQGNASYIHLHTQHRYIPVLQIFECSPESSSLVSVTKIAHSQFITVTAYHKPEINTLKTNNNPYSTGSRKDRKRDRLTPTSSSSSSVSSEACVTPPPSKRPTPSLSPAFSPAPFTPDFNMLQAYFLSQYTFPMGFPNPYFSSPFMIPTPTPTPPKIVEEEEELVVVDV